MARNMYGATSADFTLTSGGRVVPGSVLTIWSARTGGTQITDLTDVAGTAITSVTSGADGSSSAGASAGRSSAFSPPAGKPATSSARLMSASV